jgi:protein required for attachment to host cells
MSEKKMMAEGTWVVVADGHGARVLVNRGKQDEPSLSEREKLDPKDLIGEGPAGSRPQGDSPRDTDEATFAKQLAHWLYDQAHKGAYQQLILAADPTTLGQIRPQLHKEVQRRLQGEVAKTLTHATPAEILRSVTAG